MTYENLNDRQNCICGATRTDIEHRLWYVGDHGSLVWAPFYYRCPVCDSFSAVNLRFAPESYEETPIDNYCIPDAKRELNQERVRWIMQRADISQESVIYDLGAGEGAFTQALVNALPASRVVAVEADRRMPKKFSIEYKGSSIVEDYIEPFLSNSDLEETADLIVLTDVLEHVLEPDNMLSSIVKTLKPGGYAYITLPNSRSLLHQEHVKLGDIPWVRANPTYQHLWVMSPDEALQLILRHGEVIEYSRSIETNIRRDSSYSTFLIKSRH